MNLNDYRHIHFIGIGGIGVSAIAGIAHARGTAVSGSDMKESDITEALRAEGISIYIGHDAANIKGADLVVYSTAVSPENPEILAARAAGIPVITRSKALGLIMTDYEKSIAVSGTHGKTTTSTMISLILSNAGLDPTVLVGGIVNEFKSNARIGKSPLLVAEACEYMDSFLDLEPFCEVILNIDSDHLDYFKDIDHIAASFKRFTKAIRPGGMLFAYDSNPFVSAVASAYASELQGPCGNAPAAVTPPSCPGLRTPDANAQPAASSSSCPGRLIRFGLSESSDYYAKNISFDSMGYPSYDLCSKDGLIERITLSIPGEQNVTNSVAAAAVALSFGVNPGIIAQTLSSFKGTRRRFDITGRSKKGALIVDDYGHHPTEIKATLAAASHMPHKKIWCIFQPHTYTRTMALLDEFADSFSFADCVIFAEIYAAREKNIYKLSSSALLDRFRERHPGREAYFFDSFEKIAGFVSENAAADDIIITMGAGDIYKAGEMLSAVPLRGETL